ncbi:MAG TPA: glycosyltransferase [Nitrococcus sp.]|nr:glycosyltransferase [Nitrococcus sp.]
MKQLDLPTWQWSLPADAVSRKVLFAVHDWGLGHATRVLPLIRALLRRGHRVGVVSAGRALSLLRRELGAQCMYFELADIPKPLGLRPMTLYVRMTLALPEVFRIFRLEQAFARRLCLEHGFDCIVSDSRFGMALEEIPSFYIFHSLRQIIPGRPRRLEQLVEWSQRRLLARAQRILVPDSATLGLAGDLCHDLACDWSGRISYIGILTSMARMPVPEDIDCFISISGAEPQRGVFERLVLEQVSGLPGRVVIALGRPEAAEIIHDDGRLTIYGYLARARQAEMMNRARLIVTRSGYTTLMELAELGKKALLVPTLGQSEQEYLAEYHRRAGRVHSVDQRRLRLQRDVALAWEHPGFQPMSSSSESVEHFLELVVGPVSR